jgi:hypothetical protein
MNVPACRPFVYPVFVKAVGFIVGIGVAVGMTVGVAVGVAVGKYTAGDEAAGIPAMGRGQTLYGSSACGVGPGEGTAVAFMTCAGPATTGAAARDSTIANRIMYPYRITFTNLNRGGALLKVISSYARFAPGKKKKSGPLAKSERPA